ncbi:MAG: DUF3667 domain-containing protein [Oricola sp.]|nr:DUF3667 domain-containing protein [Oricola sp.]
MGTDETICQNCGTPLAGAYCYQCGQRADEPRRAVVGLVQDFFVDTMAIDGKLARSIWLLLWRPGRLARRYLDGRRVYYSPPFRLYLFASVFFFITLFWMIGAGRFVGGESDVNVDGDGEVISEELISEIEKLDPESAEKLRAEKHGHETEPEDAEEGEAPSDKEGERDWDDWNYNGPDWLEEHVRRLVVAADRLSDDPRLFAAQTKEYLPRVLLLAPVFYALILMLLYVYRRKFYVYDHFVASLYMHAALYAYLMAALLLSLIPVVPWWLASLPLLWGWLQPFVALRQIYGSNWLSVFVKWAVSITLYFTVLFFIILFGFTYSLYQS